MAGARAILLAAALAALAACATPPNADQAGDAATVKGWVTTGTFQ